MSQIANKKKTKKEYPAAALEECKFLNIAATEDQLLVKYRNIRAVRKEVVENVKNKSC